MPTNYPGSLDSASGGTPFGFANVRNFLSTTLNGAHNAAVTTITVVSTTNFPTRGLISIDTEVISYTGTTATTFTGCTRGADSTTAASHSDAATVAQVPTAMNQNDVTGAVVAVETKLGTGSSTATANTVLRGTGAGTTSFGQIVNGDIAANTIAAPSKIADGGANTVLGSNGSTPTWRQIVNGDIAANTIAAPSKIADGGANTILGSNGTAPSWRQLATGDIAASAISQIAFASASATTTTSATLVDITGLTTTITATAGGVIVAIMSIGADSSTAAAINSYSIHGNGADFHVGWNSYQDTASYQKIVTLIARWTGLSGSQTIKGRYSRNAGTLTNRNAHLIVLELKK